MQLPILITLIFIDRRHLPHFITGQLKVKNPVILGDMVGIGRTRNGDIACLQMPAQYYLSLGFTVTIGNRHDRFIVKIFRRMSSAAERIPRLHHNTVFTDVFLQSGIRQS